jgi:hypothetical protein
MLSPSECLLRSENYALAAKMTEGKKRLALLAAAAYWRNRAFALRMEGFRHLRETCESVQTASGRHGAAD